MTVSLEDSSGNQLDTDTIKFTAVDLRLTAYRPQSNGPGYNNPFPRKVVPDATAQTLGAGIRRNGDDDDNDNIPDHLDNYGGNGQDPNDTDGDGSMGDVRGGGGNREGIFDIAQQLYDDGWDVHAYDEEDADDPGDWGLKYDQSPPYREITSAIDERGVTEVAIMGYSQGGGAAQEIAEALNAHGYNVDFAVLLDAVDHQGSNAENDFPNGVDYLLNIFQENLTDLKGGEIDTTDQGPGEILEEINIKRDPGWDHSLEHDLIDDDEDVQALIRARLEQEIDR